jgi:hypothetical protein
LMASFPRACHAPRAAMFFDRAYDTSVCGRDAMLWPNLPARLSAHSDSRRRLWRRLSRRPPPCATRSHSSPGPAADKSSRAAHRVSAGPRTDTRSRSPRCQDSGGASGRARA